MNPYVAWIKSLYNDTYRPGMTDELGPYKAVEMLQNYNDNCILYQLGKIDNKYYRTTKDVIAAGERLSWSRLLMGSYMVNPETELIALSTNLFTPVEFECLNPIILKRAVK